VNGNVTRRVLDDFGRVVQLYGPYDTTVPAARVDFAPNQAVPRARTRNLLPSGGTVDTIVYVDGLTRVVQTQKTAQVHQRPLGVAISGRRRFDVMGRVAEEGIAHFVESLDPGFVDVEPVYKTTFTYDVLDRKLRTVQPNGGVFEVTYDLGRAKEDPFLRRRTTIVDALEKTRVFYRRIDDKVAADEEHLGTEIRTTRYGYDPLGELRTVVDARGNETHVEFDPLGRRTQVRTPDAGTTDFAYDDMGNLVSRQTSNLRAETKLPSTQRFVTYEYDLNHLIAIHYPVAADIKYEYGPPGAPQNGAGRVVRVVDHAGFETRGYGRLGEVVRQTRTVNPLKPNDSPQTFEMRFSLDEFGRVLSMSYPDGERLDYTYDGGGLVSRAVGVRPPTKHYDAATEVYLDALTYDEFGKRRFARLGNGAETTWTYEPDMQRLHHVHTVARGRLLQELNYSYDLVGNLKTLTNELGEPTGSRSGAVSYTFDYDDLYRLTTATGNAKARPGIVDQFKATYQFDETHNMLRLDQEHWLTTASDLGTETAFPPHTNHHFAYAYGAAGPHQATKIGDRNLVYDADGNTLRECRDHGDPTCTTNGDHLRRYSWGEDDELLAVIDGGGWNITRFLYDANGHRVVKLGRGGESITVGQFFALKGRKAATKHVFVGETRLASKLLPPPGWEPDWSEGTSPSGPIVQTAALVATSTNTNGCDPSNYQPQKCPINPSPDPVIDHRLTDTKVRPETYYYHSDHLGSTSWVTDQNGRVHEHVDYFPYGEVWRDPRSDADGAPVKGQQFLFSSKEFDEETGLYYFGARYYNPEQVTWLSADPLYLHDPAKSIAKPADLNPYAYVRHNPVNLFDPDGRDAIAQRAKNEGREAHVNVVMQNSQGRVSVDYASWKWIEMNNQGKSFPALRMAAAGTHSGAVSVRAGGPIHEAATHDKVTLKTTAQQDARLVTLAKKLEKENGKEIYWNEKKVMFRESTIQYSMPDNTCLDVSLNLMLDFVAGEARSKEDSEMARGIRSEIANISNLDPESKFKTLVKHEKDLQGIVDRARAADEGAPTRPPKAK
jgi:RHS repeat-associated protein